MEGLQCAVTASMFKVQVYKMWLAVCCLCSGYGAPLAPNPECTVVNIIVMLQVITSSLIDYCCMGLVFARWVLNGHSPAWRLHT